MAYKKQDYILGAIVLYLAYVLFFKREGYATPLYNCSQHTNEIACGGFFPKSNGCIVSQNMCKCNDKTKCTEQLSEKDSLKNNIISAQTSFINTTTAYLKDSNNKDYQEATKYGNLYNSIIDSPDYIGKNGEKAQSTAKKDSENAYSKYVEVQNKIGKIGRDIQFVNSKGLGSDGRIKAKNSIDREELFKILGNTYKNDYMRYSTVLTNQQVK